MFNLRTVWEQNFEKPVDIGCTIIANLLRTKSNTAQIIVGTLKGELLVYRICRQFTPQDLLVSVQTSAPILGILVGSFSTNYIL